jgi:hypothetical protein
MNEKNLAIMALAVLALSEFVFCWQTAQQTQNIGVIVTGLVAMIGNTFTEK